MATLTPPQYYYTLTGNPDVDQLIVGTLSDDALVTILEGGWDASLLRCNRLWFDRLSDMVGGTVAYSPVVNYYELENCEGSDHSL